MSESKISFFKNVRAKICHHCPFCSYGRKNPDSIVGKILHHKFHSDRCPMWKAEQEVYDNKK